MSHQENRGLENLVPIGSRDLARVDGVNPLVTRGLAEIAQHLASPQIPFRLNINIPGELSVRKVSGAIDAVLSTTPGIVEISPLTLAEAYQRARKRRLEILRYLNAPEVMIQNELRMLEAWRQVDLRPEKYGYEFRTSREYFNFPGLDDAVQCLCSVPNLVALDLSGCAVTDKGLANFPALARLKSLNLAGCSVTDEGLKYLRGLSRLRVLRLSKFNIYDCVPPPNHPGHDPRTLGGLGEITDDGLTNLSRLSRLKELDLFGCNVTDKGLQHIRKLANLRELNLTQCKEITNDGLGHISELSQLKRLFLSDVKNCKVSDEGLARISGLTAMEALFLGGTSVTDDGLLHLSRFDSLCELDLDGCLVTDVGLRCLRGCAKLSVLFLRECEGITDAGLEVLADLTQLRQLNLSGPSITDRGLEFLHCLAKLEWLNVAGCDNVTQTGLNRIKAALPKCEIRG
jgi:hypothetical protein